MSWDGMLYLSAMGSGRWYTKPVFLTPAHQMFAEDAALPPTLRQSGRVTWASGRLAYINIVVRRMSAHFDRIGIGSWFSQP